MGWSVGCEHGTKHDYMIDAAGFNGPIVRRARLVRHLYVREREIQKKILSFTEIDANSCYNMS